MTQLTEIIDLLRSIDDKVSKSLAVLRRIGCDLPVVPGTAPPRIDPGTSLPRDDQARHERLAEMARNLPGGP